MNDNDNEALERARQIGAAFRAMRDGSPAPRPLPTNLAPPKLDKNKALKQHGLGTMAAQALFYTSHAEAAKANDYSPGFWLETWHDLGGKRLKPGRKPRS